LLLARPTLARPAQRVPPALPLPPSRGAEPQRSGQHRMEGAGGRQPIFTRQAMRSAHRRSRGIPRLLNTICDRALLGAYATGQTRVKVAVVRRAAKEVLGRRRNQRWIGATAAAVLLAVVSSTLIATGGLRSLTARALARADQPSSRPVEAAAPAVVEERKLAEPTLATILSDPSVVADRVSAFVNLYALWGLDAKGVNAEGGCDLGRVAGL